MKVAVIGSNSLLASYIIDEFAREETNHLFLYGKENQESVAENVEYQFFRYPESVFDFSALLDCDVVVYCAATGVQANQKVDTNLIYEVNAFFPIRIINYLTDSAFQGKWISFGSYFEIGNNTSEQPYTEEDVVASGLVVPNHYCASKRLLTRFISSGVFTIKAFHFVLPTIYGARENQERLIPYLIGALKAERPVQLSAGTQVRQYLHCRDVASLAKRVSEGEYAAGIYNLAADEPMRIATLVKQIFALFGKDAQEYLGTLSTRDESMKSLIITAKKISSAIPNWRPEIDIQEGIKEYL